MTSNRSTMLEPSPGGTAAKDSSRRFSWQWVQGFAVRHAMVVVMLFVVAFFLYKSARFGTVENLTTILIAAAPFALIALGQTVVILTGGIDLSVGSVIAASAMAAAY